MGAYGALPSGATNFNYNSLGLLTDKYEYNLWNGTYPLVRHTNIQYQALSNYIADRPSQVTTYDSSNTNIVAQTTYSNYDATGNARTITYRVSPTQSLSRTFTYNPGGTVNTATDVNGQPTTYTYGACNSAFPTLIQMPLSLSRSMTWNCTGAVVTSSTDENGQPTRTDWTDSFFWRPADIVDPLGNVTNFWYVSPTYTGKYMYFNNNASITDSRVTLDPLGRVSVSQREQAPNSSLYDSVETDYDSLGRVTRVTPPYSGTAHQTNPPPAPATNISYDPLNRITQVTDAGGGTVTYTYPQNDVLQTVSGGQTFQKQYEYDGLGRLTSVCEISSTLPGVGTCGQSSPKTGYWTTYSYDALDHLIGVVQNAQSSPTQTRTYTYDSLGRMTSEANPENGTISYGYETVCGGWPASNGNLNKRTDYAGNFTCFYYDALHRLTNAAGWANNNWRGPCRRFRYDASTNGVVPPGNGWNLSNLAARLVEIETDICTAWPPTPITDEWFSYSVRGDSTDFYESTPHSGGYYHVTQVPWANGATQSLNGIPGVPSLSFNADGEGRPTAISGGTQNPVTAVGYNVAGQVTGVTFGSNDSDAFTLDPNTGRVQQYTFTINNSSVIGRLTWNQNGTLNQLQITDPFDSSNQQTCTYAYDDLARIGGSTTVPGVNCGSAWQQYFTYDAYGNITKTGSMAWQPGYDNNNHYSLTGTSYDAKGNLLTDTFHTYTWDANWGNVASIDSTTLTFDAFGRMVEQNKSGVYTQILYGPGGTKLALMNGLTTLVKAYIPLPGGTQAVYASTGLSYYRHPDWLGSSRFASTPSRTKSADGAYAPFGEPYGTGGRPPILAFSGQNQDTATGLYDFLYREYAPTQGRWISPDPTGLAAADPSNPQSWNRYGYVANGPLTTVDPLGLCRPGPNGEYVCKRVCSDTPQMCANSFMGMTDLQLQQIEVWTGTPGSENGDRRFLGYALFIFGQSEGSSTEDPANNDTNPIVPASPCNRAGNAPDPSVYQAKGQAAQNNAIKDLYYLFQFRAGGGLDAQPQGASPAYANYAYGVYMSAAGYTLNQALAGADIYAQYRSSYRPGTVMDPNHPFTPMVNVMNITYGFSAQQTGTLCHK